MSTYIKLEDVLKAINVKNTNANEVEKAINSLPSVSFEEMIKEMIEENPIQHNGQDDYNYSLGFQEALKELLNKLPK